MIKRAYILSIIIITTFSNNFCSNNNPPPYNESLDQPPSYGESLKSDKKTAYTAFINKRNKELHELKTNPNTILNTLKTNLLKDQTKKENRHPITIFINKTIHTIDINTQNEYGETALMLAIKHHQKLPDNDPHKKHENDLIHAILEKKPNILLQDIHGYDALLYAIESKQTFLYRPIFNLLQESQQSRISTFTNKFSTLKNTLCTQHTSLSTISTELLKKSYVPIITTFATRVAQRYVFGKYANSPLIPLSTALAITTIELLYQKQNPCLLGSLEHQEQINQSKTTKISNLIKDINNNKIKIGILEKERIISLINIYASKEFPIGSLLVDMVNQNKSEPLQSTESFEILKTIRLLLEYNITTTNEIIKTTNFNELPNTLIGYAARNNLIYIVGILLENKADINAPSPHNFNALNFITATGLYATNIGVPEAIGEAAISLTSDIKQIAQKKILQKFTTTTYMEVGMTALIQAVERKHYDMVTLLLAAGADINKQDITGKTALMYAIANQDKTSIELIINSNQNINFTLKDTQNQDTLIYALTYTKSNTTLSNLFNQLLTTIDDKKLTYDPNFIDTTGKTIAYYLIEHLKLSEELKIINNLTKMVKFGLKINTHGPNIQNILYYAIHKKCSAKILRCLLELGADPNALYHTEFDNINTELPNGSNTLMFALQQYQGEELKNVLEVLLACGTNPNHESINRITPLRHTIELSIESTTTVAPAIVKLLLEYGAKESTHYINRQSIIIMLLQKILNKLYTPTSWVTRKLFTPTILEKDLKNECEIVSLLILADNDLQKNGNEIVDTLIDNIFKKINKNEPNYTYFYNTITTDEEIIKKTGTSCTINTQQKQH